MKEVKQTKKTTKERPDLELNWKSLSAGFKNSVKISCRVSWETFS
jgi:hypothetical protein